MQTKGNPVHRPFDPVESESLGGPESAAVLFSAGLAEAAIDELKECLRNTPAADQRPWLMLLELYAMTQRRSAHELVAERYERTFPGAKPPLGPAPAPVHVGSAIALQGVLAGSGDLGDLHAAARGRRILPIDMGNVERIDYAFAGEFAATLRSLAGAGKRVMLVNVAEVHVVLLELFDVPSHAVVMRRKGRVAEAQLLAA